MAHWQQHEFIEIVKRHLPAAFSQVRVLDIGSADINGNTRSLFDATKYVGVDVAPGPGVDLVMGGQDAKFPAGSFDTAVSCECFEHNRFWLESFQNMYDALRLGGVLIFTCGGLGRSEHGTQRTTPGADYTADRTEDYYRNLSRFDFKRRLDLDAMFSDYAFVPNRYFKDLYFVGMKRRDRDFSEANFSEANFSEALRSIRREASKIDSKHHGVLRRVAGWTEWSVKAGAATLLGEDTYHNLNHRRRAGRRK